MYCGNCGTRIPEGADHCPECGAIITIVAKAVPEASEPIAETVSEPVTEAVFEPVAEALSEPVTEAVFEPIPEQIFEPIPEAASGAPAPGPVYRPNGLAIAALICTIAGQICCCLPLPQFFLGIAGLVLGIIGTKTKLKAMAIVSIIFSAFNILWSLIMAIIWAAAGANITMDYFEGRDFSDIFDEMFYNMFGNR